MLSKNSKKLLALGVTLSTLTGTIPGIISTTPVFASQVEATASDSEQSQYGTVLTITTDYYAPIVIAGVTAYPWNDTTQLNDPQLVVDQLNAAKTSDSFTDGYKLISAEVKDFTDSNNIAYQRVVIKLGLAEKLSDFPLSVATFDGQGLQADEYGNIYSGSWAMTAKMDTYDIVNNDYKTTVTITTDYWAPIVIAGVTAYPWNDTTKANDPNLVVTQLNAGSFTGGYKLISAEVKDFANSDGTTYQKVVVKLGLAEKLSDFPLDIATFDGQALQTDEWGNIYGDNWAITATMDVVE